MNILFLGDFFFDYEKIPEDFKRICEFIHFHNCYVVLNLESSLSNRGNAIKKRGPHLLSSNCVVEALHKLNVIAVCLANNHTMDYGESALNDTLYLLDKEGIAHVGAGKNLAEAQKELLLEIGDKKLVLQNVGWNVEETVYATRNSAGCAPYLKEMVIKNTERLRATYQNAILVNCFHWGFEYNMLPMPRDIDTAHQCIEAGCDMVIGHHPHVLQTKEQWCGKNIYYSLGNFYFSSRRKLFDKDFVHCEIKNQCDYGAGVILNTESLETSICKIEYNRSLNNSIISIQNDGYLKDMSAWDWREKRYIEDIKCFRNNFNPILKTDEIENKKKLKRLQMRYHVAQYLRKIKKTRFGRKMWQFVKEKIG